MLCGQCRPAFVHASICATLHTQWTPLHVPHKVRIHTHVSVTWDMLMDTARYCKTVALAVPTVL